MKAINVYDYLENDHTLINDLIDLNLDSSTAPDSIFETSLYGEQNEQILHDRNTAGHDVTPPNQVQIYKLYIYIYITIFILIYVMCTQFY